MDWRDPPRRLLKLAAAASDRLRPPARGVVILLYHRVGGRTATSVDLPMDLFRAQMDQLANEHRVVDLDAAIDELARPEPPTDDPVVITFDDGTADFADAVPVLVERNLPATLYAATDFIERQIPFPDGTAPVTWATLADACATGVVGVGSHTHSHALLDRLSGGEVPAELDRSITLIEDRLGRPCRHFAYPKALPGSPEAARAVRERFRSAALAGNRPNPYGVTDSYQLARSPIQRSDGMRYFARKAAGGMAAEETLRRLVNRRRYARSVT